MERKGFAPLVIIGIVALIIALGAVGYFAWRKSTESQISPPPQQVIPTQATSTPPSATSSIATVATTTNGDSYGLFSDSAGTIIDSEQDDGLISSGSYTGYHRIIAVEEGIGYDYWTFATKDYKTFIFDTTPDANGRVSTSSWFNQLKVVGGGIIPSNFPASISEGKFVLLKQYGVGELQPATGSTVFPIGISGLSFFTEPLEAFSTSTSFDIQNPSAHAEYANAANKYLLSSTQFVAQDQSGLTYDYVLIPKTAVSRFQAPNYNDEFYVKSDLIGTTNVYGTYGQLLVGACGGGGTTYALQNISNNDLVQIATSSDGVALYTLKDNNHPLIQAMYYDKIAANAEDSSYGTTGVQNFENLNSGTPPPTYQAYAAKNPILIFKDPWGRWIGVGEFDYQMDGGCGKPVVYLYPPKPMEVTVKFITPIHLTTDIPIYADGWDVMANPDGKLTDLQPKVTNCAAIDSTIPGSEYAQSACKNNNYPYLYWAGQASGQYPAPIGGWIVPQATVSDFLKQKLTQIGLTAKEQSDMTKYWVPELLTKNTSYYRISFFQTAQMNKFIPMDVSPEPNTVIRVFLDWTPLAVMPAVQPQPEVLNHISRTGFTLVEWGGLKQ